MKTRSSFLLASLLGGIICFSLFSAPVLAYQVESLSGTPDKRDFVVGPPRYELLLDPGQSVSRNITITNRFPYQVTFEVTVEDFMGSRDFGENIVFLADQKGPFSLKDYLKPEASTFTLQFGDRVTLPINLAIPLDAQPGGLFGAVMIRTIRSAPEGEVIEEVKSMVSITERIAVPFYVRIKGEAKEEGLINEFSADKKFYGQPPVNFILTYENNGNVYLKPSGTISVNNLIGTKVAEFEVRPFYILPGALKQVKTMMNSEFMFGRYTATLNLNHGYLQSDKSETRTVVFWVLPWKIVAAIVLVIFLILLLIKGLRDWFNKNFQRKPRSAKK